MLLHGLGLHPLSRWPSTVVPFRRSCSPLPPAMGRRSTAAWPIPLFSAQSVPKGADYVAGAAGEAHTTMPGVARLHKRPVTRERAARALCAPAARTSQ